MDKLCLYDVTQQTPTDVYPLMIDVKKLRGNPEDDSSFFPKSRGVVVRRILWRIAGVNGLMVFVWFNAHWCVVLSFDELERVDELAVLTRQKLECAKCLF